MLQHLLRILLIHRSRNLDPTTTKKLTLRLPNSKSPYKKRELALNIPEIYFWNVIRDSILSLFIVGTSHGGDLTILAKTFQPTKQTVRKSFYGFYSGEYVTWNSDDTLTEHLATCAYRWFSSDGSTDMSCPCPSGLKGTRYENDPRHTRLRHLPEHTAKSLAVPVPKTCTVAVDKPVRQLRTHEWKGGKKLTPPHGNRNQVSWPKHFHSQGKGRHLHLGGQATSSFDEHMRKQGFSPACFGAAVVLWVSWKRQRRGALSTWRRVPGAVRM
jgi:hypothetical protein